MTFQLRPLWGPGASSKSWNDKVHLQRGERGGAVGYWIKSWRMSFQVRQISGSTFCSEIYVLVHEGSIGGCTILPQGHTPTQFNNVHAVPIYSFSCFLAFAGSMLMQQAHYCNSNSLSWVLICFLRIRCWNSTSIAQSRRRKRRALEYLSRSNSQRPSLDFKEEPTRRFHGVSVVRLRIWSSHRQTQRMVRFNPSVWSPGPQL